MRREFLRHSEMLPRHGVLLVHSTLPLHSAPRYYELMRQTYNLCLPLLLCSDIQSLQVLASAC
jgi:hypothetical protein